ncbi:E3 ubiquitin-protein ligase RNF4-like [Hyposmocoma kahamanoa]|uniref:E3 ubiquitin-protein ligase RNF4-like n=1 Tax=Hyposmocoma kahamanoa TaxID=1477025 RepID=UPI000E6D8A21|nr:E3 ubiquitin-protein ligase RNF4-like [Hyposmocoma kahamanoa]
MAGAPTDIIDLTNDSFTLADHCTLANVVIELEDSIRDSPQRNRTNIVQKRRSLNLRNLNKNLARKEKLQENVKENNRNGINRVPRFGDCPICFDELGQNPLASTKCGHVFCLQCLEQALCREKRCPKCRCMLKGSSAYHPLFV